MNADLSQFKDDIEWFKKRLSSTEWIKLTSNLAGLRLQLQQLRSDLKQTTDEKARLDIQTNIENTSKQITQANRELTNFARTWDKTQSVLWKNFSEIWSKIDSTNRKISDFLWNFWQAWNAISWILTWVVTKIWLVGAAIAWFIKWLKESSDIARSYESAFTWFEKVFSWTAEEVAWIKKELLDLAERVPASFEELSWLAAFSAQLWVSKENIIDFVEVATQLWSATNLWAEEAVTWLVKFANVLKVPQDQIRNLGSTLVALGNKFPATEKEILNFASELQTAWVLANYSWQQILWISTAMVSVGINAEAWWSALLKTFGDISNAVIDGGTQLQKYATVAWLSATEFAKRWKEDAGMAFVDFAKWLTESWQDANAVLKELDINDIRTVKSLLSLAGAWDLVSQAINEAWVAFDENTALQNEFDNRLKTTDSRLAIVGNRWKNFWATIWQTVNNVITPALEKVTGGFFFIGDSIAVVVQIFRNLVTNAKALLGKWLVTVVWSALQKIWSLIDKLQESLWVKVFDFSKLVTFTDIEAPSFVDPFAWVAEIFWRSWERANKAIKEEKQKIEKEASDLLESLKWIDGGKKWSWSATSKKSTKEKDDLAEQKKITDESIKLVNEEADARIAALSRTQKAKEKNASEIIKIDEERDRRIREISWDWVNNIIEDAKKIATETTKQQKEAFKEQEESAKDYIDWFSGAIKKWESSITDLTSKIKSANDEIKKLSEQQLSEQEKLASKFVELTEKLRNPQQWDDLSKIQSDLQLINQFTTEAQRAEATRQSTLSDTQKIVEEIQRIESEKQAKQTEVNTLEQQKQLEIVVLEQFNIARQELEKQYTAVVKSESESRLQQLVAEIEKTKELIKIQQQAWVSWFSSQSQLNPANNSNIVNNNWWNTIVVNVTGNTSEEVINEIKAQLTDFSSWNNQ